MTTIIIIIIINNNCLKSNIHCMEIRVQWTVHLGSSHMHVHAVTRVHAVTPKLVIQVGDSYSKLYKKQNIKNH